MCAGLKSSGRLPCLAVRLSLEFRDTNPPQEFLQVEKHMRICLAATAGLNSMRTISPSEPLLAEGAYIAMADWSAAEALLQNIDDSSVSAGDQGELIAALIILLARDDVVRSQEKSPEMLDDTKLRNDGMFTGRVVTVVQLLRALFTKQEQTNWPLQPPTVYQYPQAKTVSLEEAFKGGYVWFNHFIRAEDNGVINQEYLWRLISRGAAVIVRTTNVGLTLSYLFYLARLFGRNRSRQSSSRSRMISRSRRLCDMIYSTAFVPFVQACSPRVSFLSRSFVWSLHLHPTVRR